ncbi:MAG TPA: UDP-N-acetylmuramoyl-L-alanyl-D-glutamate--2,6-diaminopimelate ligase [Mollicutes bacterium]|nr:UDP-N-acetylmuramoyl-L-alanyl-D-glutamate--2,6-diaminopimelate ligase [Mollicutes bacterium]
MKKLKELIPCKHEILISSIEEDSRVKNDNYLFCCIKGLTVDGHDYVNQAIDNGAVAVLSEKKLNVNVPVIKVEDTNKAMIEVLSRFYNEVDKKMNLIGVTGTDGKTTVTSIIYQLINQMDKAGYIGTNGIECDGYTQESNLTTPFPVQLFKALDGFYKQGCKYATIEVSSERLITNRIDDILFDIVIFTNLTKDHINNHKTYTNYRKSKGKLFGMVKDGGYSIINNDEPFADYFIKASKGKVITYGVENASDYTASDIVVLPDRLSFTLKTDEGTYLVESPLSGRFNVYNLLASIIACHKLGFEISEIVENIKKLKCIMGRTNIIDFNDCFKVVIDFAHTANSLKNLLEYVSVISRGNIITVTGSAGGRDKIKRPDMGKVVTSLSDYVIFTSDDPRDEDPNDIIDDMVSGLDINKINYRRIIDRSKAIEEALNIAKKGDVVVIAGRGNDTFMPVGSSYVRCNDFEEVYNNLEKRGVKNA